jgi:hypothetical protein
MEPKDGGGRVVPEPAAKETAQFILKVCKFK